MSGPRNAPKKVTLEGTPEQLAVRFAELKREDKTAEGRARMSRIIGGVVLVLGIGATVAMGSPLGMFGGGLGLIAGLVVGALFSRGDLEDRKIELAETMVKVFGPETKAGRPISVDIDFHGYWTVEAAHDWLNLRMVLANGVTAQLQARTSYKRKTRRKRKYTKIKDKINERLIVRLCPAKGQSLNPEAQARIPSGQLTGLNLINSKVNPKAATFVFSTPTLLRIQGRTETSQYERMPGGQHAVEAMITSYHLLGISTAQAS